MVTLAHLSDPHLAPLPGPRWSELIGKRVTGYINWQKRRQFIHDPAVLSAITADVRVQAPDHIVVTGDIANIALPGEFPRGRDWLETLGSARDVTFVPGNHDIYVREAAALAKAMGRVCATTMAKAAPSSGAAACCPDRAFNRCADGTVPCHRLARHKTARRARGHTQQAQG
jgi:3',5'-cyclic AMP phosphodiesterase CpdA